MGKGKHPGGRPKGSRNKKPGAAQPGVRPRNKKACPALSKPGHGTKWHCDTCNDSGEVDA